MNRRRAWLAAGALASAAAVLIGARALRAQDVAPSARRHDAEQLREHLRQLREHARELASAMPESSAVPAPSIGALPGRAELDWRWNKLARLRHERRLQQRAELTREFGARLDDPAAPAELRLHARRVAELGRVEFLAQNTRQGADRAALLARVAKLLAHENERHRKRLAQLTSASAPGASASSAPPKAPAPRPSGEVRP